jgi:acyl-CoA oxidase
MYASTHALVFANLIIKGKSYGFHGFMVQLRKSDGSTMPGVELGEIGPKMNGTSTNIGYSRFDHVRIPLFNLLSKYSQVTPTGEYIAAPKKLNKFRYISMMMSRMMIIAIAYRNLAQAATIAIRYSAVRRQGFVDAKDEEGGEHVVLDYQMQRYRTFKALSFAYCLFWNQVHSRAMHSHYAHYALSLCTLTMLTMHSHYALSLCTLTMHSHCAFSLCILTMHSLIHTLTAVHQGLLESRSVRHPSRR